MFMKIETERGDGILVTLGPETEKPQFSAMERESRSSVNGQTGNNAVNPGECN
jgi:hypothetical protein